MNTITATTVIPNLDVGVYGSTAARWELNANYGSAVTPQSITASNLIANLLLCATTSTNATNVLFAIRIRKVILYSPANVSSSTSSNSWEWANTAGQLYGSKPNNMVGGSVGTAYGARQVLKPPKDSPWSKWITVNSPGNVSIATVALVSGTTLDIFYDFYTDNNDGSVSVTKAGMSVGSLYRGGLDGVPLASTVFIPVGFRPA